MTAAFPDSHIFGWQQIITLAVFALMLLYGFLKSREP
jgi:hypothetical protein